MTRADREQQEIARRIRQRFERDAEHRDGVADGCDRRE